MAIENHHFKQEIRRYIIFKGSDAVREFFLISWGGSSQRRGRDAVRERRGKLYCLVVWSAWEGAILGFINLQKSIITDITAAAPPIEQVGRCIFLIWCVTKYDSICSPFGIRTLSHSHTEENTFGRLSWISLHFLSLNWKLSLKHTHLMLVPVCTGPLSILAFSSLCLPETPNAWFFFHGKKKMGPKHHHQAATQANHHTRSNEPRRLGTLKSYSSQHGAGHPNQVVCFEIFGKMCKYHVLLPSKKDGEGFFRLNWLSLAYF